MAAAIIQYGQLQIRGLKQDLRPSSPPLVAAKPCGLAQPVIRVTTKRGPCFAAGFSAGASPFCCADFKLVAALRQRSSMDFILSRIARFFDDDREPIVRESERTGSVLQIHEIMRTSPYLTAASAAKRSGLTVPTVNAALGQLQKLGMVEEATGGDAVVGCSFIAHTWTFSAKARAIGSRRHAAQYGCQLLSFALEGIERDTSEKVAGVYCPGLN
ncbi:winged helix-turn-helix transcriptional regulator (plasmid) [Ensifer sp. D2-11]